MWTGLYEQGEKLSGALLRMIRVNFDIDVGSAACKASCATWNVFQLSIFLRAEEITGNIDRFGRQLDLSDENYQTQSQSQTESQSYFTTGGLPPISSSWQVL
jgi:hypothetical protein